MRKIGLFLMVMVVSFFVATSAFALQKKYVTINGKKYLKCQAVKGYNGKASGTIGSKNDWWIIAMDPVAVWNAPECAAPGNELIFVNGRPVQHLICANNIRSARRPAAAPQKPVRLAPRNMKQSFVQQTPVPRTMRLKRPGDRCTEKGFNGDTTAAVLNATGGLPSDFFELLDREEKVLKYKAKRLYTDANGDATPYVWDDTGDCVHVKSRVEITPKQFESMLNPGERITYTNFSELQQKINGEDYGRHLTQAVILIHKQ